MLPQMMPLPWLMVFSMIFVCVYSVSLYVSGFSFGGMVADKPLKSSSCDLPW